MQPGQREPKRSASQPGLAARQLAVRLVAGVLVNRQPLEQVLGDSSGRPEFAALEPRDRALARAIAATALRRQGELEKLLSTFLERGMPADSGRLPAILLTGAAQLVCLEMPAHAVVDLAVETTRRDSSAHRFAKLVNAVLRRVSERGKALLAEQDGVRLNVPGWLWHRWSMAYGPELGRAIAAASQREAALDISVKSDAPAWAERLGGRLLDTGSIRLAPHGRIEDLPGYADGAWWVQDTAATLITRVAGDVAGLRVADLCAAPGGKTAALAVAGAAVTAVDISEPRLARLRQNLQRLNLTAEVVQADVAEWAPDAPFDAVILDAPCTATGTIRRHPDILRLKRPEDIGRMAGQQRAMLAHAAALVRTGGVLVYATCSLEPEEGQHQVDAFLAAQPGFAREAIPATEISASPDWINRDGDLRTLPCHLPLEPAELSGLDGFYAARLRRIA